MLRTQLEAQLVAKTKQLEGDYDIYQIYVDQQGLSDESKWDLDILQYLGPVEAKLTGDSRGRGLFATRDIKKGEFILVEKAFAHANNCVLDQQQ